MKHPRLTAPIAAMAVACSALLGAAAPAMAADATPPLLPLDIAANPRAGALSEGVATWTLSSSAVKKLKSAGVKASGLGSGDTGTDVKGSKISFQDEPNGSFFDPLTFKGTVVVDGGVSFKGKSKTAKVTAIKLQPGIAQNVTAKIGSKVVVIGTLKGGTAAFIQPSSGTLKGATLALSAVGAKALNKAAGGGFAKGTFATVAISATSRELPLATGTATMTLDPGIVKTLSDAGAAITVAPPATMSGNQITLPLSAGAFDPEQHTGRIVLEGPVTIGTPTVNITLTSWKVAVVGKTESSLYANFNSSASAVIGDLDLTNLVAGTNQDGTFFGTGAKVTLSKYPAGILNQNFHTNVPVGTPLGTVVLAGSFSH